MGLVTEGGRFVTGSRSVWSLGKHALMGAFGRTCVSTYYIRRLEFSEAVNLY